MKNLFYLICLFLISSIIISCEGYTCSNGIVYDKQTKLPLDSVSYKDLNNNLSMISLTDSSGKYDICGRFGGCGTNGCPDINVEFSKSGYKTQTIQNPGNDAAIFLEK